MTVNSPFAPVRSRAGLGVAVGWASHLGLDPVHMLLNNRAPDARFLPWPVVGHESSVQLPPGRVRAVHVGTRSSLVELGIWLAAAAVFLHRTSRRE